MQIVTQHLVKWKSTSQRSWSGFILVMVWKLSLSWVITSSSPKQGSTRVTHLPPFFSPWCSTQYSSKSRSKFPPWTWMLGTWMMEPWWARCLSYAKQLTSLWGRGHPGAWSCPPPTPSGVLSRGWAKPIVKLIRKYARLALGPTPNMPGWHFRWTSLMWPWWVRMEKKNPLHSCKYSLCPKIN